MTFLEAYDYWIKELSRQYFKAKLSNDNEWISAIVKNVMDTVNLTDVQKNLILEEICK